MEHITKPLLLCVLLGTNLLSCSTYDQRYRFEPAPAITEVRQGSDNQLLVARVLSVVAGLRDLDSAEAVEMQSQPGEVLEVRVRMENLSEHSLQFKASDFAITSADLQRFPTAELILQEGSANLEAGSASQFLLLFPLPVAEVEDIDWSGLNFSWQIDLHDGPAGSSVAFERVVRSRYFPPPHYGHYGFWGSYYGPYGPSWGWGWSYSYCPPPRGKR